MNHSDLLDYAARFSPPESEACIRIRDHTAQTCPGVSMICGPIVGSLMQLLIRLTGAKRCLDIGTFTGYSAVTMAEALPPEGQVISYEISKRSFAIAASMIGQSTVSNKIEMICGNALSFLPQFELGSIDFVFLDADKRHSLEYYDAIIPLLRAGGILMIDDVLWEGEVLSPESCRSQVMHALNQKILADERVHHVLLPLRHGIQLITKRYKIHEEGA